jgi:hypothetical protein
LPAEEQ